MLMWPSFAIGNEAQSTQRDLDPVKTVFVSSNLVRVENTSKATGSAEFHQRFWAVREWKISLIPVWIKWSSSAWKVRGFTADCAARQVRSACLTWHVWGSRCIWMGKNRPKPKGFKRARQTSRCVFSQMWTCLSIDLSLCSCIFTFRAKKLRCVWTKLGLNKRRSLTDICPVSIDCGQRCVICGSTQCALNFHLSQWQVWCYIPVG